MAKPVVCYGVRKKAQNFPDMHRVSIFPDAFDDELKRNPLLELVKLIIEPIAKNITDAEANPRFGCLECGSVYETEEEARRCCGASIVRTSLPVITSKGD